MRIFVATLAVIGGFFFVLQLFWLGHVERTWLPYVAHGLGALLAGAAMVRSAPSFSLRDAAIAGALAVAALAVITYVTPAVFTLTAAQTGERYVALPLAIAGSGAACAGGTWLFRLEKSSLLWVGFLATLVVACTLQLGARIGLVAGVPLTTGAMMLEIAVLAFAAGAATQAIVERQAFVACAIGAGVFTALGIIIQLNRNATIDGSTAIGLAVVVVCAGLGARVVRR